VNGGIEGVMGGRPCGVIGTAWEMRCKGGAAIGWCIGDCDIGWFIGGETVCGAGGNAVAGGGRGMEIGPGWAWCWLCGRDLFWGKRGEWGGVRLRFVLMLRLVSGMPIEKLLLDGCDCACDCERDECAWLW
jgi:hypothetical protein